MALAVASVIGGPLAAAFTAALGRGVCAKGPVGVLPAVGQRVSPAECCHLLRAHALAAGHHCRSEQADWKDKLPGLDAVVRDVLLHHDSDAVVDLEAPVLAVLWCSSG